MVPDDNLGKVAKIPGGKPPNRLRADLIVTVGGDGTVLKASREMPDPKTPILGVNMGRRGYLTEVDPDMFEKALGQWLKGEFQIEKHWKVSVLQNNRSIGEGLNEALLTPAVPAKMLSVDITIGGKKTFFARADGVIVATPTGSTAHAFSAGGPVLDSTLDGLVLALIAPLHPVRSVVVPAKSNPRVRVVNPSPDANLSIDGRFQRTIKLGDSLSFRRSSNTSLFVRFGDSFLQRTLSRLSPERDRA